MNAVAHVTTVRVSREIAAPAAELFEAWLDPAKLTRWMRPFDTIRSDVKLDPRVGGEFVIVMHTPKGAVPHTGAYQEITRPRRIVFTWNSPFAGDHGSLVTVDFHARGRSTEIVITHERLPGEEMGQAHAGGWTGILDRIGESYAEARATG
ncbi:MAG TPA: SRPBCC domain-containing protein [Steroidobacteraceae bacterium]|nr:SRPBCC domain-containing protein [Steroidobacteraceae bacterium]